MIDPKKLEQIVRQVKKSLPNSIRDLGDDVEKKIRQILQHQCNRMHLVSREEFDLQTQVLLCTREKLNELERRLKALETAPNSNQSVRLVAPSCSTTSANKAPVKED
ncbi:ubiquinone biosynthesis accessory factor UbiK [secondary endosymbiont of Ctenarytaina eucalypti]|uniref:Ubiquinone biosynthesis accessory factor UbiK n=1 Tax=secondary endosymbiont of Ctenarytaina eucalypti TaxID=1199245 RepID=J3TX42_9ENTR|nr:accessory factor UbiK family protein [secondary endosymbiont of Ctenarytaina eucalypti]AFP84660.1 hypothetical protein A359_02590 [secondary endosymbiont of Ctenarytaina eucalypti]